jgi:hypothetical protein
MSLFKATLLSSFFVLNLFSSTPKITLDQYLTNIGVTRAQNAGHMNITPEYDLKACFYVDLLKQNAEIKEIAEIGFCLGHSSYVYLNTRSDVYMTSFDLMSHWYCDAGKVFIDANFPKRNNLIKGNSLETVPSFIKTNPQKKFDLIIIDGGHEYHVALADLINMQKLAHSKTLLVMDDTDYEPVRRAWQECIKNGLVEEIKSYSGCGFGWTLGRYIK